MAGDTSDDRAITVRCSRELQLLVKWTASANDRNMSEHVRETLRENAEAELADEVIDEAERQVSQNGQDSN